ncbi:patatin-like phospholipase family protein [uncultured Hoeflea sp.]|uniref:patatin-like phospholipase family protein n=1 Tax=uncultured Hoeflea sp. TaxID=538666 RepID=UPI0030EEE8FE
MIKANRGTDRSQFFGVAFSGGGIRSSIFCLGVMQKLAASGIFKHVDYLSTVSGGGYIGSALAWWLSGNTSRDPDKMVSQFDAAENLPWGTADPNNIDEIGNPVLTHLRKNGNYLIPGNGITLLSGIGIVLRAVLLNLLVWIPIASAIFIVMHWLGSGLPAANAVEAFGSAPQFTAVFKLCILAAAGVGLVYLALSIQFSLLSWSRRAQQTPFEQLGIKQFSDLSAQKPGRWSRIAAGVIWLLVALVTLSGASLISSIVGVAPDLLQGVPGLHAYLDFLHRNVGLAVVVLFGFAIVSLAYSIGDDPAGSKGPVFLAVLLTCLLAYQATIGFPQEEGRSIRDGQWLVPFVMIIISMMLLNYRLGRLFRWLRRVPSVSSRYSGRRSFEKWAGLLLIFAAVLLAVGTLPLVHFSIYQKVGQDGGGIAGLFGVLTGVLSGFWGLYQSAGKGGGGRFTSLILKIGAAALLFGLAILSFQVAGKVSEAAGLVESTAEYVARAETTTQSGGETAASPPQIQTQKPVSALSDNQDAARLIQVGFWTWFAVAVITGAFANLNYISLGRFYRDRLVEAFMPDRETTMEDHPGAAGLADQLKLSEVWENHRGPYPLINTNIVLANANSLKHRMRGGASFILSPGMCGSDATGWLNTKFFDGNEMTLGTAMAISGAAANPRTGIGGKGITRNKTVSLVMNLLNFRLGYWVNNPRKPETMLEKTLARIAGNIRPNHFFPSGYYSATGKGYAENSKFSELSDGGHFENLGLYELVRRRCRLIIICDGGQDNSASYSDFVTAIRRIEADFGAKITLNKQAGPERMIAKAREGMYPSNALYADKGYFVAKVVYADMPDGAGWAKEGVIIYMKTTMIEDLSMKAKGYKGANPDFPDQSTGDQFFDDEQFEAYRELGYSIAGQAVEDLGLEGSFKKGRPRFDLDWEENILKLAEAPA